MDFEIYKILFLDAFRSMYSMSLSIETAWFAAIAFGTYSVLPITLACYAGGVLGALVSTGIGYVLSLLKDRVITLDEELYTRLSKNASKYGIYVFLFQMIPFVKIFYLFAGMLRIPFKRVVVITLVGRALFYLYYLYILPLIPSL